MKADNLSVPPLPGPMPSGAFRRVGNAFEESRRSHCADDAEGRIAEIEQPASIFCGDGILANKDRHPDNLFERLTHTHSRSMTRRDKGRAKCQQSNVLTFDNDRRLVSPDGSSEQLIVTVSRDPVCRAFADKWLELTARTPSACREAGMPRSNYAPLASLRPGVPGVNRLTRAPHPLIDARE